MKDFSVVKGMDDSHIADIVEEILSQATLPEKVGMMSGKGFYQQYRESNRRWGAHAYRAGGGIERLNVPALYFTDGPRGVARGNSTCFPCSMARGATFDPQLEKRIGEVMGIESRAQDANLSGAVCINLLRHPAWGRAQETYGEDQHHLGEMGAALGEGIQAHNIIGTVKHFALNSMENARFKVNVKVDERTLHEVYLPHFKRCIDAGIATVMTAYNKINGEYCGQHHHLLTDILRNEWDFKGFVHSDWINGVYQTYGATAGLDIENPEPEVFGERLLRAISDGFISEETVNTACRRILTITYSFLSAIDPLPNYSLDMVASQPHINIALEAAEKSAVLLENDGALPLQKSSVTKVAVLGRLAALENTGDTGSSRVAPPYIVTALAGITNYLSDDAVLHADESDLSAIAAAATEADVSIVVVGTTAQEEGEYVPGDISLGKDGLSDEAVENGASPPKIAKGGDRVSLTLPEDQIAMIKEVTKTGKPVVVVIVSGSAILVEEWRDGVSAIVQTFYSGMEGGTALAKLLFGEISPSGKLPITVAKQADHYPYFDRDALEIEYGYWHGYAKLQYENLTARYPFGHGLSYTTFDYRSVVATTLPDCISVNVAVANTGSIEADEVIQVYFGYPGTVKPRPLRQLKAFKRVTLAPNETKVVNLCIPLKDLEYRDPVSHSWKREQGIHHIFVARSAQDENPLTTSVEL